MSTEITRVNLKDVKVRREDRIFFGIARIAALFSLSTVFLIFFYLAYKSKDTFKNQGLSFITGSTWNASEGVFQLAPMLIGSLVISLIALSIAIPSAIGVAYFIEFMAPFRISKIAVTLIDLLAAIPSIIIGLWGVYVFSPVLEGWARLLNQYLGFVPIFENSADNYLRSPFIGGWILAIMMIPIITSVSREVMSQVDKELINAAHALGGNKFKIMFKVILPTAKGGILGGILLGLGRGLGETIAILYTLNLIFEINVFRPLENKGGSVASLIAGQFGEASDAEISALLAAGVVLFMLTLIVNMVASGIVQRAEKRMAS